MKTLNKLFLVMIFFVMISCCKERASIYHDPYFEKGTELMVKIDNELVYHKKFDKKRFAKGDLQLVDRFCPKDKEYKIYYKVNNIDTTFTIDPSIRKMWMLYKTQEKSFMLFTEKDKDMWKTLY